MNPENEVTEPMPELALVDSEPLPLHAETSLARINAWTRDINALCRAVEAQQRASGSSKH